MPQLSLIWEPEKPEIKLTKEIQIELANLLGEFFAMLVHETLKTESEKKGKNNE